jgi:hypothetical protein
MEYDGISADYNVANDLFRVLPKALQSAKFTLKFGVKNDSS